MVPSVFRIRSTRLPAALSIAIAIALGPLLSAQSSAPQPGVVTPPPEAVKAPPNGNDRIVEEKKPGFDVGKYVQFDGQLRFRYEFARPWAYTANAPPAMDGGITTNDQALYMRTRIGFLLTPHEKVALRFQLQDSRIWGEEGADRVNVPAGIHPPTGSNPSGSVSTSIDKVDIHQAYVDLKNFFEDTLGTNALLFRIGRQELSYGDQRLVSPLDWSNIGRAWDAAKVSLSPASIPGEFKVDLFASIIRDKASSDVGGGPSSVDTYDKKQYFYGLYAAFADIRPADNWCWMDSTGKIHPFLGRHQADAYVFLNDYDDNSFTGEHGTLGNITEWTFGLRGAGEFLRNTAGAGFDYSAEVAYQTGDYAEDNISAYGYALVGAYTIAARSMGDTKLRLSVEYDYGSGDKDPTDGQRNTFDPLFPFGHLYQGVQDIFGWKNGQDLALRAKLLFPKDWRVADVELQYHFFWLASRKDAWYNAALQTLRVDPTGTSGNTVGQELDLTLRYLLVPGCADLSFGYSHFFPGDFVKNTGREVSRDFVYAQLAVNF
jgi:hypothetical protein